MHKNNSLSATKNGPAKLPVILNVTMLGLLAGISFAVELGLLPVLNHLAAPAYVTVMQGIIPTFTNTVMPLVACGLITHLYRLAKHQPRGSRSHWVVILSFAFFIAGIVLTVAGLFPLNHQIAGWSVQNPPANWETIRSQWAQLNFWRFTVAILGFITGVSPLLCKRNSNLQKLDSIDSSPLENLPSSSGQLTA